MARSLAKTVTHELRQMLPPVVYFGIGFNALVLTIDGLSPDAAATPISHLTACVGALLVAKAVIGAEMLPFFNRFNGRSRFVSILWKSFLYYILTTVLHVAERAFSASRSSEGFDAGVAADVQAFDWSHFGVVQMWLAILVFTYTSLMVFVRDLGHESVYDAYFR